jgi:hypothetical protein
VYVDGALALTTTLTAQNQTHDVVVASGSTGSPVQLFPGTIDEVAYYGAALSASRVNAHYDAARYGGLVAAAGPVAWYRLDESGSPTTVSDASGHGHAATVHGSPGFGAAGALAHDIDTAASFDGSVDWLDVGDPAALQGSNGSVEAWIKTANADSDYHAVAIKWYAFGLFVKSGSLVTYDWSTGTTHDTGADVADGAWHHVVLTYASGVSNGSKVYVDGTLALTTTITAANQAHDAIVANGSTDSPTELFPGTIDEVAYYDRRLSAGEVALHHSAGEH